MPKPRRLRAERRGQTDDFRRGVVALNRRIHSFNLKASPISLHKLPFIIGSLSGLNGTTGGA
jgi:hypothetical protein